MTPSEAFRPMTLAIMQPYLFPYLGYFQLMNAAHRFVVYDDVNYMKQGWVNRNFILVNGKAHLFTLPLSQASAYVPINGLDVHPTGYDRWRGKFLSTLGQAYAKAPYRKEVQALVDRILFPGARRLSEILLLGLGEVKNYLGCEAEFVPSSSTYGNSDLAGTDRVLDICAREDAHIYINAIGGKELYSNERFRASGVKLHFLRSNPVAYAQGKQAFVPNLSILDVMMWNPREQVQEWMGNYVLE